MSLPLYAKLIHHVLITKAKFFQRFISQFLESFRSIRQHDLLLLSQAFASIIILIWHDRNPFSNKHQFIAFPYIASITKIKWHVQHPFVK